MKITDENDEFEIEIYAIGLCYCSICTDLHNIRRLTLELNLRHHSGVGCGWKLAKKPFESGDPNPCPCNDENRAKKGFKHYLFVT